MSVKVKYKNNEIANITETETKTLKTEGKYCEADILIENTELTLKSLVATANDSYSPPAGSAYAYVIVDVPQGGYPEPTGTIDIYNNGSVNVKDYETANVEVIPNLQDKIVNQNGLVEADEGFDGLNSVVVNVEGGTTEGYSVDSVDNGDGTQTLKIVEGFIPSGGKKHEVEVTPINDKAAITIDCPFKPTSLMVLRQEPFVANADSRGVYRGAYFEIFDNETLQFGLYIANDNSATISNSGASTLSETLVRVVSYNEAENKATLYIAAAGRTMTVGKTYTFIFGG